MKIETVWYEISPYIYAAGGITAILYSPGSFLLKASGFLLFSAVITILGLRWLYRSDLPQTTDCALDRKKYDALLKHDLFYDAEIK